MTKTKSEIQKEFDQNFSYIEDMVKEVEKDKNQIVIDIIKKEDRYFHLLTVEKTKFSGRFSRYFLRIDKNKEVDYNYEFFILDKEEIKKANDFLGVSK